MMGVTVAMERRLNLSLAQRLKTETRALHTGAERSKFMQALLSGRLDRTAYCSLLRNLHALYAVLEPALERHAKLPEIAPVFLPMLWRTQALCHDLAALHGPGWAEAIALQPATSVYVDRLHDLDQSRPALLLAHAYVRYLGDLSGGQLLRGIVAKNPALAGDTAISFYDFGNALATGKLTQAFRAGLAAVPTDDKLAAALIDEAKLAFEGHRELFDQLDLARL
jgi:heme oxygenase